MKVLAIGAHPDDIEFGMGATLAKHIQAGHEAAVVFITDGSRDEHGNRVNSESRREEAFKALEILGIKENIHFLGYLEVTEFPQTIQPIEKIIKKMKPDRIYTHSRQDRHQDHRKCHLAVMSAGRYVNEIILFEIFSVFPDFIPNYVINVSRELIDLKIKALSQYKSQFQNMELLAKMIEGMSIKNSFGNYATQTQTIRYAEGFEIGKIVKDELNF